MLLIIDNYDSFTYNLVQYFGELKAKMKIFRNDALTIKKIKDLKPSRIVISPGPGRPEDAGISVDIIKELGGKIPILGVCLGHQAIGYAFGGKIIQAKHLMHGKTSPISHNKKGLFKNVTSPFEATRYHSLVIDKKTLPDCLEVTAWTKDQDKEIMAVSHKTLPIWGVQFHPESILTKTGKTILKNFLSLK
ncbi:MAG: anthranilate/aminodeoxychorismate synthase component II [Omnitrophica WOR_2 bacterium GWA2_47_8]|nr:MAG: anthranilate/aminodeoxychorismate synthase component II [Omnitrophica WOR_2 bacterium GWA2_47_8]